MLWDNIQIWHMPKAAGSQLTRVFHEVLDEKFILQTKNRHQYRPKDRFTVMTMRNPLAMYVSEWGYGHRGMGTWHNMAIRSGNGDLYDCDLHDFDKFAEWVKWITGVFRAPMKYRYDSVCRGHSDQVDAWVYQENFKDDTISALEKAEKCGVNLKEGWRDMLDEYLEKNKGDRPENHHRPYEEFYTPELRKYVLEREEYLFKKYYPEELE